MNTGLKPHLLGSGSILTLNFNSISNLDKLLPLDFGTVKRLRWLCGRRSLEARVCRWSPRHPASPS